MRRAAAKATRIFFAATFPALGVAVTRNGRVHLIAAGFAIVALIHAALEDSQ